MKLQLDSRMERAATQLNISTRGLFFLLLFGLIAVGTCCTFFLRYMLNRVDRRASNLDPRHRVMASKVTS